MRKSNDAKIAHIAMYVNDLVARRFFQQNISLKAFLPRGGGQGGGMVHKKIE